MEQRNQPVPPASAIGRAVVRTSVAFPRLRMAAEPFVTESLRRRLIPLVLEAGYRYFNRGRTIRHKNFVADFSLYQAAELLGTVGTFHGATALDRVNEELLDAFEDVRFSPEAVTRLDDDRLIFVVRFSATGRGSGLKVDRQIAHYWTFRGVRAARLEVYWDPQEAFEAASGGR